MTETELNNTVLYANGPVPADGFLRTRNTSDDVDYFKVHLKGKRQVAATAVGVNKSCGEIKLTRADGDWSMWFDANLNAPDKGTWTTPRDDTEYIGSTSDGTYNSSVGCQALISFTPADAVTIEPISVPDYGRTLALAAPIKVPVSAAFSFTASGHSADEDKLVAWLVSGGCGASPSTTTDPGSSQRTEGPAMAFGDFSQALTLTAPSEYTPTLQLCVWLVDGLSRLATLQRQQPIQIGDPPPPPTAATAVTIAFAKGRYRGRVTSADLACYRGIRVELRRRGKGDRSYGSTVTRQDGSWTIRRSKVRGKMYAIVPAQNSRGVDCQSSASSALPKRH